MLSLTAEQIKEKESQGFRFKYGFMWPPMVDGSPAPDWFIEKCAYIEKIGDQPINISQSTEWLGKKEHLRRFMNIIFAGKHTNTPFEWNPNVEKMFEYYFKYQFLGVVGHKSSSKSELSAALAVAEWLCDPYNTTCLLTSTTMQESKMRIWGRVEHYWSIAKDFFGGEGNMPGELISSRCCITARVFNPDGTSRRDNTKGLFLIAGDKKKYNENSGVGKFKGFKAQRVRFYADELSDLTPQLVKDAETNLFQVGEGFKMLASMNANLHTDAGGDFCRPKNGWDCPVANVRDAEGWETDRGYVIRFDAAFSPNVVAKKAIWNGLITYEDYMDRLEKIGNNPNFERQYRARWPEDGAADTIYSMSLIIKGKAQRPAAFEDQVIYLAGADPSFEHDGDRFPLVIGKLGIACDEKDTHGNPVRLMTLAFHDLIYIDDDLDTSLDKNHQTTDKLAEILRTKYIINKGDLGMDVTGGGSGIASMMAWKWCDGIHKINFKSAASDKPVSNLDKRNGNEIYANKMSEIWHVGIEFIRCGQIRNLPNEIVHQMVQRTFSEDSKGRIVVEPKKEYKTRIGSSPDEADAFMIMLDVARQKHGFIANRSAIKDHKPKTDPVFDEFQFNKLLKENKNERNQKIFSKCKRYYMSSRLSRFYHQG